MDKLPSVSIKDRVSARSKIVNDFIEAHYGGSWEDSVEKEIYTNPIYQYSSGVLYPQGINVNEECDTGVDAFNEETISEDDENELEHNRNLRQAEQDENDEEDLNTVDLSSQQKPSAFGINFLIPNEGNFIIKYGFSKFSEETNPAPKSTSKRKYDKDFFKEKKFKGEVEFKSSKNLSIEEIIEDNLKIVIKTREKDNLLLASVSMLNTQKFNKSESTDKY